METGDTVNRYLVFLKKALTLVYCPSCHLATRDARLSQQSATKYTDVTAHDILNLDGQ